MDAFGYARSRTKSACDFLESTISSSTDRRQSEWSMRDTNTLSFSDITSSIEGSLSGARASLTDFVDKMFVNGDATGDFKRKVLLNTNNREKRRNDMKKRYRQLYTNINCTPGGSPCYNEEEEIFEDDNTNVKTCNETEQSPLKNVDSREDPYHGSIGEKVSRWVSSIYTKESENLSRTGTLDDDCHIKRHNSQLLKCNSDLTRRKFQQAVSYKETPNMVNAKSFQDVNRAPDWERYSERFGNFEEIDPFDKQDKPFDHKQIVLLPPTLQRERKSQRDFNHEDTFILEKYGSDICQQTVDCDKTCDSSESSNFEPSTVKPDSVDEGKKDTGSRVVGLVNVVVHYIQPSLLKLSVQSLGIDKLPGYSSKMSVFVKASMTLPVNTKEKCSTVVRGKNVTFFNQDIYLKMNDYSQASQLKVKLTVYEKKWIFARKRIKPLAEALICIEKNDVNSRQELTRVLTACV